MRFLAAVVSLLAVPALAATIAGVEVPPPLPPKPVSDTFFGVTVEDPYRFLEDTKDPAVVQWMQAQADATTAILGKIPGRDALLTRMKEIEDGASGLVDQVQRSAGGRWFFLKRDPGENQFRLVWRERVGGPDRLLLDPEALRKATGKPHAVLDFTPSPDGRRIAYAVQAGGGEIGTLHVVDVATGKELTPPLDRIRYAGVDWLDDGSGFFYSRLREGYEKLPPTERFADRTVHFHALDTANTDRPVFSPSRNQDLALPVFASGHVSQVPGTQSALLRVRLGVDPNMLMYVGDLAQAKAGTAKWRQVVGAGDRVHAAGAAGGYLYLKSANGSPRFKVLRVPLAAADLASAETVIPESKGVITDIALGKDALYAARREGATFALLRVPHQKKIDVANVALPFAGSVAPTADERLPGAVLELGGWTRATRPWFYDPAKRTVAALPFVTVGKFDAPPDIAAREVMVRSHDGVEVPVSILARPDVKLDGSNPTLIYGYGAYGITEDPFFSPRWYAWVERGGVIAVAHVRGGGVFGEEWHQAGKKTTKANTWKDAIAAAEWLIANRYTSPAKLGIFGGSAGGIFVGRAITERPDLFAAAVPQVGVFQGTRFEASANGVANVPEFGSVKNEDEFKALMAMSTYEHVKPGTKYPAVLFEHGVNDIRVDVWQTTKMASRLAPATASGRPVLMRLEYDSGHGQGSTREQAQLRTADTWAFFLWQFGDPAFQPK
jgi:prolyl oligopeptidase